MLFFVKRNGEGGFSANCGGAFSSIFRQFGQNPEEECYKSFALQTVRVIFLMR